MKNRTIIGIIQKMDEDLPEDKELRPMRIKTNEEDDDDDDEDDDSSDTGGIDLPMSESNLTKEEITVIDEKGEEIHAKSVDDL